jgi:class 3 adenylate cyclase
VNKNIGDAFLLAWKFHEDDIDRDEEKDSVNAKDTLVTHQMADMAVLSFVKINANINRSKKLYRYRQMEALKERLGNFKVKMGFGLHIGWAIEGAIGSFYKIDASYLSPIVNMSSRLEAATR